MASTFNIPSGRALAAVLRPIFHRQGQETRACLTSHRLPNLAKYTPIMASLARPIIARYWQKGVYDTGRRLARKQGLPARKGLVTRICNSTIDLILKDRPPDFAFDIFRTLEVQQAIDRAAFDFCAETNAFAVGELGDALDMLRNSLMQGLSKGEAIKELNGRVFALFDDSFRAARIGQTEASRGMHAGQLIAAEESGIVSHVEWLASSDACERCLELDGKRVETGSAFHIEEKGGPYAVVQHPPLHPFCMCALTEVIG